MEFREEILTYARKIAAMRYPAEMLAANNGLQPLDDWMLDGVLQPGLRTKYQHELLEGFQEAKRDWLTLQSQEKLRAMRGEAGDCVYYAVQIDEQQHTTDVLEDTLSNLAGPSSQIDPEHAKIATREKYLLRSEKPDSKDHTREDRAIELAINRYERQKARENRQEPGVLSARRIPSRVIAVFSQEAAKRGETLENYVRTVLINHAISSAQHDSNYADLLKDLLKEAVEQMKL